MSSSGSSSGSNKANNPFARFVGAVQRTVQEKQQERQRAAQAEALGQIWNAQLKEWVFYRLDEEMETTQARLDEAKQNSGNTSSGSGSASVQDTTYYDLLQIAPSASDTELRKAYFKQARTCHPDKNPDDPDAHAKFQQLGQAYQILSNPTTRQSYDRNGITEETEQANGSSMDNMDPFVFFNVMFGSTLVEPYIGELWIASMSDSVMKDAPSENETDIGKEAAHEELEIQKMKELRRQQEWQQTIRQCTIARNLRTRVADCYQDSTTSTQIHNLETFQQSARDEAWQIAKNNSFGGMYLQTIGFSMTVAADEYLGFLGYTATGNSSNSKNSSNSNSNNTVDEDPNKLWGAVVGHVARTRQRTNAIQSNFKLLGAGIKAAGAGARAMQQAEQMQQKMAMAASSASSGNGGESAGATAKAAGESSGAAAEGAAGLSEEEQAAAMEQTLDGSLPAFLELAWAVNKRDIQSTVQTAVGKLLNDSSSSVSATESATLWTKPQRVARARAVHRLGQEFLNVAKEHRRNNASSDKSGNNSNNIFDPQEIKARVAVATMTTMAKAQGQEVSEEDTAEMMRQAKEQQQQQQQQGPPVYPVDGDDGTEPPVQPSASSSSSSSSG